MVIRSLRYTRTTRVAPSSARSYIPYTLQVLQRMVTHSQFCMSGDNTIQVHGK